ncbi:unnamed protein product, partial [marine sediment metagenome]
MRVSGEGEVAAAGGNRGDLYVDVYVRSHKIFTRDGNDILCAVPIGFTLAVLGGEIEVPTLDGKVKMKVPTGTQPNRVFRLRGKGIPDIHGRGRGDELVRIIVEIPTRLNKKQRELLEEFARTSGENIYPQSKSFMEKVRQA